KFLGLNPCGHLQKASAHLDRHDDFFQRGISRALSDAIDGALDLTRAVMNSGQGVRDRETEVVVAVHTQCDSIDARNPALNVAYQPAILIGHAVAYGVRNIDDRRAGLDDSIEYLAEVIDVRTPGVFRGELNVIAKAGGEMDG